MGLAVYGISFFTWCLLVTLGFPNIWVPIVSLVISLYVLIKKNNGIIQKKREVLILFVPIAVILFFGHGFISLDTLRYIAWLLVGIIGIYISDNLKSTKLVFRIFLMVHLIVFFTLLIQLLIPNVFKTIIEPFINSRDTFYYKYNQLHGIHYGIACDKGAATLSGLLIVGFVFFNDVSKRMSTWKRIVLCICATVVCAFAGSRTSLVMIPLCIFMAHVICTSDKKKVIAMFRGILIAIVLIVIIWVFGRYFGNITAFNRIVETIESIFGESNNNTGAVSSGRDILYLAAINGIGDSPLFGHGWLAFNTTHIGIIDEGTASYVHNIILQLLYDTGIIGTILFISPLVYYLIKSISLARKISNSKTDRFPEELKMSIFFQIYFVVDSLLHVGLLDYMIFYLYLLSIAMYYVAKRRLHVASNNKYEL